jgi:pilus assembly protein CpaB
MKPARLIVLAIALGAAGVAGLLMMQSPKQTETVVVEKAAPVRTTDVLVASAELPVGQTLKPGDVRWQPWPSDYVPGGAIQRSEAPDLGEFTGSIVRYAFLSGEPIRREKLIKANSNAFMSAILPAGMRAIAISIDTRGATSAGGFVLPNDRVDVLRTFRDEESSKSTGIDVQLSETILSNIRVLAIGQNIQERNGEKVVTGETATLEVTPAQAETLALAQKTGQLSLALRSLADAGRTETVREEKQDAGVTVIRYGVARQSARR